MFEKLKQINKNQKQIITNNIVFGFFVLILVAAFSFGMAVSKVSAASGINKSINYQGKLMDSSGNFVADGGYQIKFVLYDALSGGTQLWSASTTNGLPGGAPGSLTVNVTNGLFSVLLGDTSTGQVAIPETIFNNDNVFLGITIATDTEMLPRKRLSAVPYAFNAGALQGQKASSTIANTGGDLFKLAQNSTDSAVATRTALLIESLGTSNQYDYLVRMSNGTSDVFTVNRQGNATTTGSMSVAGFLSVQGIRLDAVGTTPLTSGAYLVGVYDEFTFSNATTVQATLKDLDTVIGNVSSSAMGLNLQDVTNNGNTTTNALEFYGGTSTGDLMPGAHLTYDLGRKGNRWDEIWVRKTRLGTNSWTLEADANNTFLLSEDTFGNYFAITEDGKVGIGTSTPYFFDLEVNGTVGPSQHNLYDLGTNELAWRNITLAGTVSSTKGLFGSVTTTNLNVLGYVSTTEIYINGQKLELNPNIFQGTQSTAFNDSTNGNWESIALNSNRKDSYYTHTNGNSDVTITATGTYRISGHVSFEMVTDLGGERSVNQARIYKNNNSSVTDVIYSYSRNVASGEGTATIPSTIVNLNTGDYLELQAAKVSGASEVESLSASLLIEKVTFTSQSVGGNSVGNLQQVTDVGSVTTNNIQFVGGTSTADFRFQQDVWVDGNVSSTSALFVNATGTNLALLGYINSNLSPMVSDIYTLGDATHRWQGLMVNYVTSTNVLATGYVSSSAMYINGQAVTTSVPTLDQVTTQGNVTANAIQFGGGTSTGSILPGLTDAYDLGSADYRWNEIFGNSFFVGTSTPWSITEEGNQAFSISNNGSEMARITADGNLYVGTTAYAGGLDATFSPNGNEILANGDIGSMGSVYAGTSFRAGATSTVYSKSSLYKQDGGDYLFQFADVAASPDLISGFELSFPPADWNTGGNANWFQDSSTSTQGTYSAQSGDINDLELNYIETNYTFSSDGILSFSWKVSSEATYDFLLFCVDNAINCTDAGAGDYARISGETNWATVSVPITAGTHNLRWVYDKDYSVSNGSDAGWIDNVRFSPYSGQNWRFYTANAERLTIAYNGNIGIGISEPESKLDINGETKARGNVTITPAPTKTEVAWSTTNIPATGIEAVRSLVTFNGYLYAGQGDSAGDGDIQICNPAGGGSATLCDNSADWSESYTNAIYSQVLSMIVYKGRLYAGFGDGAGLGDVMVCNPATTGGEDTCDAGDWSSANFPAGPDRITQLIEYNGFLYAANDTGVSGSAAVAICNPAGGGDSTGCDNAADWTNNTLPINYEEVNSMVVHLNSLYAFVGNSTDDSDTFYCTPSLAGNVNTCDSSSDWVRPFDNTAGAYESAYSATVYNGYLYLGTGLSNGDGDVHRCEPQAAGDDLLCDNAGDWTTVIDNPSQVQKITAMMNYDGSLYIGQEGSTNNGNVIEFTGSNYKISHNVSGLEAVYSFAVLNGVLYSGRGNSIGDGQVYFYQKAREASHALRMEAGSSTGSMWFSSESLNYQGAGTDYEAQTGAFKFSHGLITEAGAYDLAEMYPTLDGGISAGEVVVLDKDNPGYIKKSDLAYAKNIVGVVSAKPGFLLSGKEKDKDLRAVALVGRVPVKVSLENGDIKVGDPLTSSAQPGYAMKVTKPGMIIGHAMEDLPAISSSSTQDLSATSTNTGTVMMVVQTGYYFGDNETPLGQIAGFLGETTSTQVVQQAFDGDAYAIEQIAGGLVNPQVADGSALNEVSSAQLDILIVRTAVLIAGDLTVGGDSKLLGHVIVSNETAGVVALPAGDNYVEIQFATPFENVPVVVVTPESDADEYFTPWLGKFRIAKKTVNGFRIEVDEGACMDPTNCGRTMKFNWIAVGVMQSETASSTSTIVTPTSTIDAVTSTQTVIDDTASDAPQEDVVTEVVIDEPEVNQDTLEVAEESTIEGDVVEVIVDEPTTEEPVVEEPGEEIVPTESSGLVVEEIQIVPEESPEPVIEPSGEVVE